MAASLDECSEDGWSDKSIASDAPSVHEWASQSPDSSRPTTPSEASLSSPGPESETTAPDCSVDEVRSILQCRLEQAGVFPRNWTVRAGPPLDRDQDNDDMAPSTSPLLPYPKLFAGLASLVVQADLLMRWTASRDKECFKLHLPTGLDNPFFVASLVTQLAASQRDLQLTTAILRYDGAGAGAVERLLMSLCLPLLSYPDAYLDFPELLADFKAAFAGPNRAWRERLLWALLTCLITNGEHEHVVLVLSFPFEAIAELAPLFAAVERLRELTRSTERTIQILLILGPGQIYDPHVKNDVLNTLHVDLSDSKVMESLRISLLSWFTSRTVGRPLLSDHNETIVSAVSQRFSQPILIVSALDALQTCPWLSMDRLTTEIDLLCSTNSILARIPEVDRSRVADVLSILSYCERPLAIPELADALAIAQSPSLSKQPGEKTYLDLRFDLLHTLSGLIHVERGRIWLVSSCAAYSSGQQRLSPDNPTWLDLGPNAEMRLALICLRYISHWSAVDDLWESVATSDGYDLDRKFAFLNYAVTFWYHHYSRAIRDGAAGTEVAELLHSEPELLHKWINLQAAFDPLRKKLADEVKAIDAVILEYGYLPLLDVIAIVDLAAQFLPTMDGDVSSAVAFGILHFRHQAAEIPVPVSPGMRPLQVRNASVKTLAKALACLPESLLKTLLANQDVLVLFHQNAMFFLKAAVRQGNGKVIEECLPHVPVDAHLVSFLAESVPLDAGWIPILQAIPSATRHLLRIQSLSRVIMRLFRGAIKYGQLQLLNVLIEYDDLTFSQIDLLDIVSVATEAGQQSTVQRLLERHLKEPLTCTSGNETPLHCASARNFPNIAGHLLANGAIVEAKDEDGDTPAHIAARQGHTDILSLLIEANKKALRDSTSETPDGSRVTDGVDEERTDELYDGSPPESGDVLVMENEGGAIPLEVAIRSGDEAVVSLLLEHTPRTTVLSRELIHIAILSDKCNVLQLLLKVPGVDPTRKDDRGWLPLERACQESSFEMTQILMEHGAEAWPLDIDDPVDFPFSRLRFAEDKSNAREIAALFTSQRIKAKLSMINGVFLYVADNGDEVLLSTLLDAGADKNTTNESKRTALHICAYHGHEAAVRLLLLRGADSTALDEFDDSPLADATAGGHLSIMRLLLERGERYSIDGTEKVLRKLAENGQNAALKTILDFQKDLLGTKILENCFHSALRRNNVDLVSILLEYDADANPASVVRYHGSAIHECAYYGNIKMARVLLDHPNVVKSTMVNSLTSRFSTPLIAAVAWDYERLSLDPRKQTFTRIVNRRVTKQRKMVKFLIEQGGDPKIRGSRYGTMLNAAAAKGQPELVEFVLDEVGLDINEVDDEGRSPAHVACSLLNVLNTTDTLELLSKRAGVSSLWTTDKYGRLPIHFACGGQRLDILDYLLAEKTTKDRINESDHDGWTPLHWACRQWDVLLIRCLVAKHGAKTNCRTNDGWTPWDVAVFHDNLDFASALERYDPNPDADAAVTKGGEQWNADCDSCLCMIYGTRYRCRSCPDYDLCFKCYPRAAGLHWKDHAFEARETNEARRDGLFIEAPRHVATGAAEESILEAETEELEPEEEGSDDDSLALTNASD